MRKWSHLVITVGIVAASLSLPLEASALITINMPSAGTVRVGMVAGEAWAAFQPSGGGSCTWFDVGTAAGLSDDVQVNGSGGTDSMIGTSSSGWAFCSWTFNAIVLNGRQLGFKGNGGQDFLSQRATWLAGDGGDDFLYGNDGVTGSIAGGTGNDRMIAGNGAVIDGGSGNDAYCTIGGTTPFWADGGDGTGDVYCGTVPFFFSNFESVNPSSCPVPCVS